MKNLLSHTLALATGMIMVIGGTAIAQIESTTMQSPTFSDVEKEAYFSGSVEKLVRRGIVRGYDSGKFGPNDYVTRGQVTVMIDRYDENVVQPLRQQIAKLRSLMDLGSCGDGHVQEGEQCDDGNNVNGDGCSKECLKEVTIQPGGVCPGGHQAGDRWNASDACNICQCLRTGEIECTKTACKGSPDLCGNGICEKGEATVCYDTPCSPGGDSDCETSCRIGTCQKDCPESPQQCIRAGEMISGAPDVNKKKCCPGLKSISISQMGEEGICISAVGALICSECGNGRCEEWENNCNCSQDCN